jgi:predicted protein tyrosine phosphatase
MITRIFAKSLEQMTALVNKRPSLPQKHCFISIVGGRASHLFPVDTGRVLTLEFDDVSLAQFAVMTDEDRSTFSLFSEVQADRIIDFLLRNHHQPGNRCLLLHCTLGVFRSGAVAAFACKLLKLDPFRFAKDNPQIHPNDMVAQILERRWAERRLLESRIAS